MAEINWEEIRTVDTFDYNLISDLKVQKIKKGYKRKRKYLDVITAFDIEATNLKHLKESVMYIWMFQVCGYTVIGRYWYEFVEFLSKVQERMTDDTYIVVWVHNLAYEFQFLKSIIPIDSLMAMDDRKVLNFRSGQFEFRCSYLHSNMGLRKYLESQGVEHLKTELDYDVQRFPWTELTDEELRYCINDVLGLVEALEHEMKMDNDDLTTIPLTSTGYIRRKAKKVLGRYQKYIKSILPDLDIMIMLRKEFRGGNTHANAYNAGYVIDAEDEGTVIDSWDMSSAYPACLLSYKYPGTFYEGVPDLFELYIRHGKAVLMDVVLKNVKLHVEDYGCPYIAQAKTDYVVNPLMDNGRVRSCDEVKMVINEIDFQILRSQYSFDMTILKLYQAKKQYLPQAFRELILEEYKAKTELKGVDDYMYQKAKNRFNSLYGMLVQNPMKVDYVFEDGMIVEDHFKSNQELIEEYQEHGWVPYQWGCWCTSYARMRLELGIQCLGDASSFLYCDTDAVKCLGDYSRQFRELNKTIINEDYYAIDKKGKKHYIGIYEKENDKPIKRWISLGAKKYCYEDDDGLHLTLSGVSKSGAKELGSIYNFKEGFIFRESAGTESYYNDKSDHYIKVDGHELHITSNVYIQESTYELGLYMDYKRLLYALGKVNFSRDWYFDIQPSIIITDDE